eukprot:TRINITY_DN17960_c0_g1_i1.p1 TRINITY_DN17960_c0_g1~~TRINITY_DN17960_c0_g1_i1.p1  ORF type:complete len:338 (-),score=18.97 TRINITY_DN17960_c0_g1_i1:109-1122(-)
MGSRNSTAQKESPAPNVQDQYNFNRILMLGRPNAGKRTIFKQAKLIFGKGYSQAERMDFVSAVHQSFVDSIQKLLRRAEVLEAEHGSLTSITADALPAKQRVLQLDKNTQIDEQIRELLRVLWLDAGVQATYDFESKANRLDNKYIFDSFERMLQADYCPTDQDIIHVSGGSFNDSSEVTIPVYNFGYRLFRVPHFSPDIQHVTTGVLYVASLSDYDQFNPTNPNSNLLHETLDDFERICALPWLEGLPIIVWLNKSDEFKEKLRRVDLSVCFPDYPQSGQDAIEFVQEKFHARNHNPRKTIYIQYPCGTDTDVMNQMFHMIAEVIFRIDPAPQGLI